MSITCSDIGILYRIGKRIHRKRNARLSWMHGNRIELTSSNIEPFGKTCREAISLDYK